MKSDRTLHKKLGIISIILFILGLSSFVFFIVTNTYEILAPFIFFVVFSFITFSSSFLIISENKLWVKNLDKYYWFAYPILLLSIILMMNLNNVLLEIFIALILLVIIFPAIAKLFLLNKSSSSKTTIMLLVLIVLCIIYRRYRLPYSPIPLTLSIIWFALGIYMFGIRSLYIIKNNRYLINLSFSVCLLVTLAFLGLLFKLMHWPISGLLLLTSTALMLGVTLIVLFTIPNSNYVDWSVFHKKILRKLLYPWIFVFLLFLFKFLVPELWVKIFPSERVKHKVEAGFNMVDYPIENKNGLE